MTKLNRKQIASAFTLSLMAGLGAGLAMAEEQDERPAPGSRMLERFDANGDGVISQAEVDAYRAARFAEMDSDGDGLVSQEEATAYREQKRAERRARRGRHGFDRLDVNGDGYLSLEEMDAAPGPRIMRLDTNNDGVVDAEELEAGAEKMRRKRRGRRGS